MKSAAKFVKWCWKGIFQEKIPLWLHVLTIAGTIFVTVQIAPIVNEKFEREKIKTAFVVDSLNSINALTGDLAVNITVFNYCENNTPGRCLEKIQGAQSAIVRLQWKAIQLRAIMSATEDRVVILEFQKELDSVSTILNSPNLRSQSGVLDRQVAKFGLSSVKLVERVAAQAGIKT